MTSAIAEQSSTLSSTTTATETSDSSNKPESSKSNRNNKKKGNGSNPSSKSNQNQSSAKLRGLPKDSVEVRVSKTLSWLLRHGAQSEGLKMRPDGYVKVTDLLSNPKILSQSLDLAGLQAIVQADAKQRYSLISEKNEVGVEEWWIKANQGHSLKSVQLELQPVLSFSDIPSGLAIHGTNKQAWGAISKQGLSKMKRNHIHLAQGLTGQAISGMRKSATIFIYINVPLALSEGVKFFLSDNGVVLTEGNGKGFLSTRYFEKVEIRENGNVQVLEGWGAARTFSDVDSFDTQIQEKLADVRIT
ncbi:hypothetical protein L218DRAFT_955842 [Marasmius fiardii PR-910]|nr:hypothetical protein L218DRAFT_955842 [Marasmius fiardii PR-910]